MGWEDTYEGAVRYPELSHRFTAESAEDRIKKFPSLGEISTPNRFFQLVTPIKTYKELPFLSRAAMNAKLSNLEKGDLRNLYKVFEHEETKNDDFFDQFELSIWSEGLMAISTDHQEDHFVLLLGAPNGYVYQYYHADDIPERSKRLLEDKNIR